jgi:hypothetical protein
MLPASRQHFARASNPQVHCKTHRSMIAGSPGFAGGFPVWKIVDAACISTGSFCVSLATAGDYHSKRLKTIHPATTAAPIHSAVPIDHPEGSTGIPESLIPGSGNGGVTPMVYWLPTLPRIVCT